MTPEEADACVAAVEAAKARANGWVEVAIAEPEPTTARPRDPALRPPPPDATA